MGLSDPQLARNKVASLSKRHHPQSPQLTEARRDLAAAKLAAYVAKVVAEAPPLTDDQRHRISSILTGVVARDA